MPVKEQEYHYGNFINRSTGNSVLEEAQNMMLFFWTLILMGGWGGGDFEMGVETKGKIERKWDNRGVAVDR